MTQPKTNAQGDFKDSRFDRPDIVAAIEEAAEYADAHKAYQTATKTWKTLVKALNIEVPIGGEVRLAVGPYVIKLTNPEGGHVEFDRDNGVRIGAPKLLE